MTENDEINEKNIELEVTNDKSQSMIQEFNTNNLDNDEKSKLQISFLETEVSNNKNTIDEIKSKLKEKENEVETLTQEQNTFESRLEGQRGTINSYKTQIKQKRTDHESLNAQLIA